MLTRNVLHMVVAGVAVAGCATDADGPGTASVPGGDELLMGSPACGEAARRLARDLGGHELRVELAGAGEYTLDEVHRVTLSSEDGRSLDWTAEIPVDAVLVYGGRRTQAYIYDPEARADEGLVAPRNKVDGRPPISTVVFCYDYELEISATAKTSFERRREWSIELAPEHENLTVAAGQVKWASFRATVAPRGWVESGWRVAGELRLANPFHAPVEVTGFAERAGEVPVKVNCPELLPFTVPAFGSVTCHYSAALPDAGARALVLEAKTVGEVGSLAAEIAVDFGGAEIVERDLQAWVWDYHLGFLGYTDRARVFDFELPIGPYAYCPAVGIFMDSAVLYPDDTASREEARTWMRVKVTCD